MVQRAHFLIAHLTNKHESKASINWLNTRTFKCQIHLANADQIHESDCLVLTHSRGIQMAVK